MTKKVFIKSFGCQMNEYDSSKMVDMMCTERDMEQTKDPSEADLILLNTCSIREKPQEKVFSQLGRWKPLKNQNPELIIGVGGCVASQEGENIIKRAPYVDIVFGPQTLHRLPKLYDDAVKTRMPSIDTSFPKIEKFSKNLAERGVREINLLGQNVNAYRAKDMHGIKLRLADLLHLVADIDGVDRIRFTTSHPLQFTDDLISSFENRKLANYLHLPVQSGSDRILKLMERKHKIELYIDRIEKLRSIRPDISISSDFIVGFPGETDVDFEETIDLINKIKFDQSFSFIFSPRPNTPAAEMIDDVPYKEKLRRLNELQALINQNANKISQSMIGSEQNVLVEKQSKKDHHQITGRTENNRWVNFDGPRDLIGSFVNLHITEALPNSLRARLVN